MSIMLMLAIGVHVTSEEVRLTMKWPVVLYGSYNSLSVYSPI